MWKNLLLTQRIHYLKILYTFYFNSRETNYILNFQQYYMLLKHHYRKTKPKGLLLCPLTVVCSLYDLDNIMVELFFIFMPRVFVQNMGDLFPYIVLFGFGKRIITPKSFLIAQTVSTQDFFGTEKFILSESIFSSIFVTVVELMFLINVVDWVFLLLDIRFGNLDLISLSSHLSCFSFFEFVFVGRVH